MNNIINSEGFDLMHICNAINCQEVYLKSTDAYNGRPKYVKYVNKKYGINFLKNCRK